jgi:hypothetical protein
MSDDGEKKKFVVHRTFENCFNGLCGEVFLVGRFGSLSDATLLRKLRTLTN